MRILLINIPHPAIGSRIPKEQLPPLGLLAVGGPLIDEGHEVSLLDGELGPMSLAAIVEEAVRRASDAVLFGHSGSSSGHPIIADVARRVHQALPDARIIYGGVHPTYFWREILSSEPWVDFIVKGEGEETARRLMRALEDGDEVHEVPGIAFMRDGKPYATPAAPVIQTLDDYRVGWELIDHRRYSYWGGKRAVVIQFSRGCPHLCNYCGQRGFWTRWRHRDPEKLADEIAWLHREHGVEVFNFADENPSAGRKPWLAFLKAIVARNLDVTLVGSTRAGDIVRDRNELHLYKQAGFERFLMGMEATDEPTLKLIRKGAAPSVDREAIRLLRQHGILSMATWVAGFDEQTDRDFWQGLRQLIDYDPDQVQMLYVTPHRWTPYYRLAENREVIQPDLRRWDYKHQILSMKRMPAWRVFLWVKVMEVTCQARPRALRRLIWRPDAKIRHATRWYYRMGRRVWFHEILSFVFRDGRVSDGRTVREHMGAVQDHEEEASAVVRRASPRLRIEPVAGMTRLIG